MHTSLTFHLFSYTPNHFFIHSLTPNHSSIYSLEPQPFLYSFAHPQPFLHLLPRTPTIPSYIPLHPNDPFIYSNKPTILLSIYGTLDHSSIYSLAPAAIDSFIFSHPNHSFIPSHPNHSFTILLSTFNYLFIYSPSLPPISFLDVSWHLFMAFDGIICGLVLVN